MVRLLSFKDRSAIHIDVTSLEAYSCVRCLHCEHEALVHIIGCCVTYHNKGEQALALLRGGAGQS